MFKTYQKYLIKNFLKKFINITLIFFSLVCIMGILEELNFFKDIEASGFFPYLLTILNSPITLFQIFPFIFLIASLIFMYELFKKHELNLLKVNGLTNFKIIKILFLVSFIIGIFNILIFYNFASTFKFHYSTIKNEFSMDNKYLAMVTENGLWIKDEHEGKTYIIKSSNIDNEFLTNTTINEFDKDFKLIKTIRSSKINIKNNEWIIYNPIISIQNNTKFYEKSISFKSNFNHEKISNLFSNISAFSLFQLIDLKSDYEKFGYSTDEVKIHLLKLTTTPIYYGVITVFSLIIIFNFAREKSLLFLIILGISLSVLIYYMNFIFYSLGENGKIPVYLSVYFPLFIIVILSVIGLININEKK